MSKQKPTVYAKEDRPKTVRPAQNMDTMVDGPVPYNPESNRHLMEPNTKPDPTPVRSEQIPLVHSTYDLAPGGHLTPSTGIPSEADALLSDLLRKH